MTQESAQKKFEQAGVRFTFVTSVAIAVSILGLSGSSICFKFSADQWASHQTLALINFIAGIVISFVGATATTVALKNNDTNIVYATIGGPGSVVLHFSLAVVFQQTLPWWQWLAIAIIVIGAALLHVNPRRLFRER